ncbi:sensor histidine kinase [Ideonella benzenivorans]|uniref:sensor histidine kinase n=1 Tax=Ideonella benzenivorans TaxID=2831643 RepID=UPI001CEDF881|nr:histidine kinase [Ideonella benzenivorans]
MSPTSSDTQTTLFDELRPDGPRPGTPAALPGCSSGMVLRSLWLVHAVLGAGLLFVTRSLGHWVALLSQAAAVAVPATLGWLLVVCAARPLIARLPAWVQAGGIASVGGLAALCAWVPMNRLGVSGDVQTTWLAPWMAGSLLAWLLLLSERWRHRARLPAATAARLADLQTRIRPHFLFNTLNTAIALVQVDPRRAEEVLEDLAELFRAALGAMDESTTLREEVALSRRYLDIEQLRFGNRLRLEWDLDPQADDVRLPPLVLQPLIENAVRYGVEPSDRGGKIEIRTRRRRDRVLVSVTNTVPLEGGASRRGHGIGLASVRERLRLMHDLDADFHSGIIEDGRWRASLSVPAG